MAKSLSFLKTKNTR